MNNSACLLFLLLLSNFTAVSAQSKTISVEFTGNKEFSSDKLKGEFSKCPYSLSERLTVEEMTSGVDLCLRGTVFDAYGARGMSIWKSTEISAEKRGEAWLVRVAISEPEPVNLGSFTIERTTYLGTQAGELEKRFPLRPGDRLNYPVVADYINSVRNTYDEKGFLAFDFDLDRNLSRKPDTNHLVEDLVMTIREDRPFIISGIEIVRNYEGNVLRDEKLNDGAVRKALGLTEGEVYNEAKLQKGIKKLNTICWHCKFENIRQSNKYTGGWSSSRGMGLVEDYDNRTVRIIIELSEPVLVSK